MKRKRNAPVSMQIYLGSGEEAEMLRETLEKRLGRKQSLSEYVVELLRKADPTLFVGDKA